MSSCYGGGKRGSLIEVSLTSLRGEGPGDEDDEGPEIFSDSTSDQTDPEARGGVGFFFKVRGRAQSALSGATRHTRLLDPISSPKSVASNRVPWRAESTQVLIPTNHYSY